jgi:hypothetical protein
MHSHWRPAATLPCLLAVLALGLLAGGSAAADPGYYVVTPYDNEGLRIVDLRYWTLKPTDQAETVWPEFGLGWGVNSRWTTELFVSWEGSAHEAVRPATLNWQNDLLLTQGQWPFDLALHAQLIKDRDAPHQLGAEWGPVLQTEFGRTQINLNLFFDQVFHAETPTQTRLKYQWQLRQHAGYAVQLGVQGFGELGPWDHWSAAQRQSHRAGPAAFFDWRLASGQTFKLQAAWLVGKTYGQRGHMFTLRAHHEF